jgi:hypothetical protein
MNNQFSESDPEPKNISKLLLNGLIKKEKPWTGLKILELSL